jgi:FkbM family methyltransferase
MMTSYAGNFEDVLLSRIFRDVASGFYVDIGAHHARFGSTTYAFHEQGWTGINVEPTDLIASHIELRPRDLNLKIAIGDHDGEARFFWHPEIPATSTLLSDVHPAVSDRITLRSEVTVPILRMSTFVERYIRDRHVHFLKVDIEGGEPALFGFCDWQAFRPEVIVSEAVHPWTNIPVHSEWSGHLLRSGYTMTLFDGINAWFVREESPHLVAAASYPVNCLDTFTPYDAEKIRLKQQLEATEAELNALRDPRPSPAAPLVKK